MVSLGAAAAARDRHGGFQAGNNNFVPSTIGAGGAAGNFVNIPRDRRKLATEIRQRGGSAVDEGVRHRVAGEIAGLAEIAIGKAGREIGITANREVHRNVDSRGYGSCGCLIDDHALRKSCDRYRAGKRRGEQCISHGVCPFRM